MVGNFFRSPRCLLWKKKKGQCHTSKICGKNKYVQKLYLLWNLSDLNQIINENTIVKNETETKERLFKLWKFRQMYDFINPQHKFI